ncbi:unnamed protein product [Arabis nemorensis]|uniref:ENTH domain-containing protein n=1 Tax=Arabis nemorensis TaxID=586526 RepID=A0A565B156_9BRAS|nr:unnamed protein product [Arabis nemorensis]
MGTLWFGEIKKQASLFLQDKYNVARLVLTDVTEAELLVEEATNDDPSSPDAKTMTKITEASFDTVDYWRIVAVLHRKIIWKEEGEMKKWREAYKAMVLLEFLLTHGLIQKKADQIQTLLLGKEELREARLKALKITSQINNGFGNSSHFSASPSLDSFSLGRSSDSTPIKRDDPVSESDWLIREEDEKNQSAGEETLIRGICSKIAGFSPLKKLHGGPTAAGFHTLSNVERVSSKCYDRCNE